MIRYTQRQEVINLLWSIASIIALPFIIIWSIGAIEWHIHGAQVKWRLEHMQQPEAVLDEQYLVKR